MTGRSREWSRRYPPLAVIAVALALAVFTLPSALNLPQTNPSQLTEYAPVPGESNSASAGGNFAGLGLGSSQTAGQGLLSGDGVGPSLGLPPGSGKVPSAKSCVGNPPRQTEDPLSPPCVAFFSGDNGGATYQGVTKTDITTLFVYDGGCEGPGTCTGYGPTNRGTEYNPPTGYYDLGQAADSRPNQDMILMRELRLWQQYFNARYQTYGRTVHFWVYFTDGSVGTTASRTATAADNFSHLHPFASFSRLTTFGESYFDAMAQKGVLNFGNYSLRTAQALGAYPKLVWGYDPSVEVYARMFNSFVCTKLQPYPVSFSGNTLDKGKPRRFGVVYVDDPRHTEMRAYERAVEQGLGACGITFGDDRSLMPGSANDVANLPTDMARFRTDGVTTVVVVGGSFDSAGSHSHVAAGQGYFPEWVFAGDGGVEGDLDSQQFDQQEMSHAWLVTPQLLDLHASVESACAEAVHAIDTTVSGLDLGWYCQSYDDLRQYFDGIQVSGPRLGPSAIDQGFRAIPPHSSSSPQIPACFYDPGDYTCVKDAIAEWWDSAGGNSDSQTSGCWRAILGGRRFLPGKWPSGPVSDQQNMQTDPCNTFKGKVS